MAVHESFVLVSNALFRALDWTQVHNPSTRDLSPALPFLNSDYSAFEWRIPKFALETQRKPYTAPFAKRDEHVFLRQRAYPVLMIN
jgi:hypothetical protein